LAEFIKHKDCPDCGSSDARAVYSDGGEHCFSCKAYKLGEDVKEQRSSSSSLSRYRRLTGKGQKEDMEIKPSTKPAITEEENKEIKGFTSNKAKGFRSIRDDIYTKFGVRHAFDESTGEVIEQFYPTTQEGQLVGYKIREVPKDFRSKGRTGADCELFMQFKFNRGGKYILITEGEVDALSAYQMLNDALKARGSDFEIAVVSPTTGAQSRKQIAAQYKFLDTFDHVILSYDNDLSLIHI
jgi:twinkle protein